MKSYSMLHLWRNVFLCGITLFAFNSANAQSGQKYGTDRNILTPADGIGSKNYEAFNIYTNNIKRASFTKDGAFDLLKRGYFHSNLYCDSLVQSWAVTTLQLQTATALITGNAQVGGNLTTYTLTVNSTSQFTGHATFTTLSANSIGTTSLTVTANATVDSILTTWKHLSGNVSTNTLNVTGTANLHKVIISDGVSVTSLAGNKQGLIQYDTTGKLTRLDFISDTNTVLTGSGAFRKINSLVPPDTSWKWNGNILETDAKVVNVKNNIAVGGRMLVGYGTKIISNGSNIDTMRSSRPLNVVSDAGRIGIKADTVNVSELQVTSVAGSNLVLEAKQSDTLFLFAKEAVQVGKADTGKPFPPSSGKVALDVAGDMRTSGSIVSRRFMFDDQYGISFDPISNPMSGAPPLIAIGRGIPIAVPPCTSVTSATLSMNGRIQSVAQNGQYASALTFESVGWGGHGLIEVEGTNNQGTAENALWINYFCGRNTLINTNTGLPNGGGTVFMGRRVSMFKAARIGWFGGNPVDETIALNIEVNPDETSPGSGNWVSRKGIVFNTWDNSAKLISVENVNFPNTSTFTVYGDGKVGIGESIATIPAGYLLAVKGKIIAEDITLKLYSDGWPDYVYAPGYKFPTWLERKSYHEKNRCMMYMERAAEVNVNGMTLGRNMTGLTRNMEEAWKEIIELHEENETLKAELEQLKKKIEKLERNK